VSVISLDVAPPVLTGEFYGEHFLEETLILSHLRQKSPLGQLPSFTRAGVGAQGHSWGIWTHFGQVI